MATPGDHPPDRGHETSVEDADARPGAIRRDRGRHGLAALLVGLTIGITGVYASVFGAAPSNGLVWEAPGSADAPKGSAMTGPADSGERASTADGDGGHFVRLPGDIVAASGTDSHGRRGGEGSSSIDAGVASSTTTVDSAPPTPPPQTDDAPAVVARSVRAPTPEELPPVAPPPPWSDTTFVTAGGHLSTAAGCVSAGSSHPGAAELDEFFASRVGPVTGWDYQHVYPLGGDRYLWLFQDAFIDHSGGAVTLGQASFAHNVALVQEGGCFRLLHRGSVARPASFEAGTGSRTLSTWFWPMGGELHDGRLHVFWVQMVKDAQDPSPPDGLGWHPAETWVATYDPSTLARLDFRRAANPGVSPVYGYAVASDESHTYLFGNSFEQNLAREGGYWAGRHSATRMYLARVPLGHMAAPPEYRTSDGWTRDAGAAVPILDRHWAEFPFQPRFVGGQWVGVAAVNGYWGDEFSVDVAAEPWGPWTTVHSLSVQPRGQDPAMNTYHAHLVPWRDASGNLVVTMSNNARDMRRDAWPHPHRYRPVAFSLPWLATPPPPAPPTSTTTTTSTAATTTSTTMIAAPTTSIATTSIATTTATSTKAGPATTSSPETISPSVSAPSSSTSSATTDGAGTSPTGPPAAQDADG